MLGQEIKVPVIYRLAWCVVGNPVALTPSSHLLASLLGYTGLCAECSANSGTDVLACCVIAALGLCWVVLFRTCRRICGGKQRGNLRISIYWDVIGANLMAADVFHQTTERQQNKEQSTPGYHSLWSWET